LDLFEYLLGNTEAWFRNQIWIYLNIFWAILRGSEILQTEKGVIVMDNPLILFW
jgi:hypothetical protein